MSPDPEHQRGRAAAVADPFAHMVAILRGLFVLPELRAPGRHVQPLELRRVALGIPHDDAPE